MSPEYANYPERRERTDDFPVPPEGLQQLVICDFEKLGMKQIRWKGQSKMKPRMALYLLSEHRDENGKMMSVREEFTDSLWETARLRKFLNRARGKALTEAECRKFDYEKLIGVNLVTLISHNVTPAKTYANIVVDATKPYTGDSPLRIPEDYKRKKDRVQREPDAGYRTPEQEWEDEIPF